jgi:glycosyltransferase involved in cell wall biosynthesis
MKKILIITYYWPPSGGSGVQRWMYFAKHMEENGMIPVVITIDSEKAAYPAYDHSLSKKVEHVRVIRTKPGFNLFKAYSFLKSGKSKKIVPVGDVGGRKKTLFDSISAYVRGNYFIPDARVGWNKQVIPVAKELLKAEHFDAIITTGPPHSTHLIALALKKTFPIHWIADFRDPWHDIYYNSIFKRTKKADAKDEAFEKLVLQTADTVLTVGPSMKELLSSKYNGLKEKTFFIYNGYDSELFKDISAKRYNEFTIAHIGVWTLKQAHQEIIDALNFILINTSDLKIRFVVAGNIEQEILDKLKNIPNLILDFKGKISHKEALQEMMNANLLLNCLAVQEQSKILISGKLMEYIATGNEILVIGNTEGDAAKLIHNINNAHIISPGNTEEIKEVLLKVIKNPKTDSNSANFITQFSRAATTKELVNLLNLRLQSSQASKTNIN